MIEVEVWRPVLGHEDFYEVSSHGRVRSKDREVKCSRGSNIRLWKGRVLKSIVAATRGYEQVSLSCSGKTHKVYVHRLVAEAFLKGMDETVNHINGDKRNNKVNNLEWCSYSDNNRHAFAIGLKKPSGGRNGRSNR
jgi:hypothetical protein